MLFTCIIPKFSFKKLFMILVFARSALGFAESIPEQKHENAKIKAEKQIERIEVVGTKIRSLSGKSLVSPQIYTSEDIRESGARNVAEFLSSYSTFVSFGSPRPQVSSGTTNQESVQTISLRGLSSRQTLILIDGYRATPNAGTGSFDLNRLSPSDIERIEIIADGAHPIYGSDAAAGVINIVTKGYPEGWSISLQSIRPEKAGGEQDSGSIGYGISGHLFESYTSLYVEKEKGLFDSQRAWSQEGWSTNSFPANYADAKKRNSNGGFNWHNYKDNPSACSGRVSLSGLCEFNYAPFLQYYPDEQRLGLLQKIGLKMPNNDKLEIKALVGRQISYHQYPPLATSTEILPPEVANSLGLPESELQTGNPLVYRYRALSLGPRNYSAETTNYDVRTVYQKNIENGWDLSLTVGSGFDKTKIKADGFLIRSGFNDLVRTGAFNPLSQTGGEILNSAEYESWENFKSTSESLEFKINRDAIYFLGSEHSIVFGADLSRSTYSSEADSNALIIERESGLPDEPIIGFTSSLGRGSREAYAAFFESKSIFSPENQLSISGRLDTYSDVGSSFNYRFGYGYQVLDSIGLSAAYATGFRAPDLRSMHQGVERKSPFAIDYKRCLAGFSPNTSCKPMQYRGYLSGNPELNEEKFESRSAKVLISPFSEVQSSMTYWAIDIRNAVLDETDWNAYLEAESKGVDLESLGVKIDRGGTDSGEISRIIVKKQNTSRQSLVGYDFNLRYSEKISRVIPVYAELLYSELLKFDEEAVDGIGIRNRLGDSEKPRWKNSNKFNIAYESYSAALTNTNIAGHKKWDQVSRVGENLAPYTSWDLFLGKSFRSMSRLSIGISNVFDRIPPIDDTKEGHNRVSNRLYSALGRSYIVSFDAAY